jgi:hypothetical protein
MFILKNTAVCPSMGSIYGTIPRQKLFTVSLTVIISAGIKITTTDYNQPDNTRKYKYKQSIHIITDRGNTNQEPP